VASSTTSLLVKFQHSKNIWKQLTKFFGLNGLNERRLLDWEIKDQQKKGLVPSHRILHISLEVLCLIVRMIPIKFNLKRISLVHC